MSIVYWEFRFSNGGTRLLSLWVEDDRRSGKRLLPQAQSERAVGLPVVCIVSNSIDINIPCNLYCRQIQISLMKKRSSDAIHVWLVLNKAVQAITGYAATGIQHAGLGDSDFRVLEVLLHKGPLPVNTIGPKVNLTPGSISVAVDRLYDKGLVSRVESTEDRRIRIVALTPKGKKLIVPVFRKHAAEMERVFAELSAEELQQLERILKKVGRRAEALGASSDLASAEIRMTAIRTKIGPRNKILASEDLYKVTERQDRS
jgi:MarR family transcriptional regulator, 2-MHQ and catechol-resistance regulon repressor